MTFVIEYHRHRYTDSDYQTYNDADHHNYSFYGCWVDSSIASRWCISTTRRAGVKNRQYCFVTFLTNCSKSTRLIWKMNVCLPTLWTIYKHNPRYSAITSSSCKTPLTKPYAKIWKQWKFNRFKVQAMLLKILENSHTFSFNFVGADGNMLQSTN